MDGVVVYVWGIPGDEAFDRLFSLKADDIPRFFFVFIFAFFPPLLTLYVECVVLWGVTHYTVNPGWWVPRWMLGCLYETGLEWIYMYCFVLRKRLEIRIESKRSKLHAVLA